MAQVANAGLASGSAMVGQLFADKKFFLVQRLPMRTRFIKDIEDNGGHIVKIEQQADYVIADHVRHDAPPGSISYKFIEIALSTGEIPLEDDFKAGSPKGIVRDVGSRVPGRNTRTPFTTEDDKVLYEWVKSFEARGGGLKGNEIYKQLEQKNPRHTFQSWRDRYIKFVSVRPPAGAVEHTTTHSIVPESPPTPIPQLSDAHVPDSRSTARSIWKEKAANAKCETHMSSFTEDDFNALLNEAVHIEEVPAENRADPWKTWADTYPGHSADEWRAYYGYTVLPAHKQRLKDAGAKPENVSTANKPIEVGRSDSSSKVASEIPVKPHASAASAVSLSPATSGTAKMTAASGAQGRSIPELSKRKRAEEIEMIDEPVETRKPTANEPAHLKRQRVDAPSSDDVVAGQDRPINVADSGPNSGAIDVVDISSKSSHSSDNSEASEGPIQRIAIESSEADAAARMQLQDDIQRQRIHNLTAENLAQNQAIHNPKSTHKAADLAEDDENDDQENYVAYLQGLLPKGQRQDHLKKVKGEPLPKDSSDVDGGSPTLHDVEEGACRTNADNSDIESQKIELDLPDPPGGWDNGFSSPDSERPFPSVEEVFHPGRKRGNLGDTQAIYGADTQALDLDIPDFADVPDIPETEDYDLPRHPFNGSRSPEIPESVIAAPEPASTDELDKYLVSKIDKGHTEVDISTALQRTSMRPQYADIVLDFLQRGLGIPEVIACIWTEEEDRLVESSDKNAIKRLTKKHGSDEVYDRLRFLGDFRDAPEE